MTLTTKIFCFFFALLAAVSVYSNSFEAKIVVGTFFLFILLATEKQLRFKTDFFLNASLLLLIVFMALLGGLLYQNDLYSSIKDFFYLVKPVLFLVIGYFIAKKINNSTDFLKLVVLTGAVFALYHCAVFLVYYLGNNLMKVDAIREATGKDNFLELVALAIMIANYRFKQLKFSYPKLLLLLFSASFILYFSRTMLLLLVVVSLGFLGYLKISKKGLKYIFILILGVLGLYAYLFSVKIERDSDSTVERFMYKLKLAPAEIFVQERSIDVNDHAKLWDHWRAYEAGSAIQGLNDNGVKAWVFGMGAGGLVDLGFYAPLSDTPKGMRYISHLHNGYSFILYKAGLVGLVLYLLFLLNNYYYYKKQKNHSPLIANMVFGLTLFYLGATLVITGIYNLSDPVTLVLGGLFYFKKEVEVE